MYDRGQATTGIHIRLWRFVIVKNWSWIVGDEKGLACELARKEVQLGIKVALGLGLGARVGVGTGCSI